MELVLTFKPVVKRLAVLMLPVLAGCASSPKDALLSVQQEVGDKSSVHVAWPRSGMEKSEAGRAVHDLLMQDLTSDTAVQIALFNNRALRATFEDIGLSEADLIAAGRLHNPTFSASVRWPNRGPGGPNVQLSLVADILDDLLIPLRKRVARAELARAELRVAREVLALAAEVKEAVYKVQGLQEFRTRLGAIAEINDAAADLARRQFDAGNINSLELANQQLSSQRAKIEATRTDAELRVDREKLNRLLGIAGTQTNWTLSAKLPPLPDQERSFEGLEDLALAQRLDLAAAKIDVELAETAFNLKRKTRLFPASLNLGVDTERDQAGGRVTGPILDLGLPLFDQGQADLARLSAQARRATDYYEGLVTDISSEVREARDAVLATRAAADFYTKTVLPQRRLIVRETLLYYNAMQKSPYELLVAKEGQLVAERESIESVRDYWIARAQLERAVGGKLTRDGTEPASVALKDKSVAHEHLSQK